MQSKSKQWNLIVVIAVIITACGGADPESQNEESRTNNEDTVTSTPLFSSPVEILPYIQNAILTDSLELLQALCHPDQLRSRSNTALKLCEISSDNLEAITQCNEWFSKSWVVENIIYSNDTAWMQTVLDGIQQYPLLILERSNNNWYLIDMQLVNDLN